MLGNLKEHVMVEAWEGVEGGSQGGKLLSTIPQLRVRMPVALNAVLMIREVYDSCYSTR